MTNTPAIRVISGLLRHPVKRDIVFMAQRPLNKLRPGMWEYPGGRIEAGEYAAHAIVREWKEELDADIVDVDFMGIVHIPFEMGLCSITLCEVRLVRPSIEELTHSEHMASCWVSPVQAIMNLPCTPSTYLFYPAVCDLLKQP